MLRTAGVWTEESSAVLFLVNKLFHYRFHPKNGPTSNRLYVMFFSDRAVRVPGIRACKHARGPAQGEEHPPGFFNPQGGNVGSRVPQCGGRELTTESLM